jgi:hypothetical protein
MIAGRARFDEVLIGFQFSALSIAFNLARMRLCVRHGGCSSASRDAMLESGPSGSVQGVLSNERRRKGEQTGNTNIDLNLARQSPTLLSSSPRMRAAPQRKFGASHLADQSASLEGDPGAPISPATK